MTLSSFWHGLRPRAPAGRLCDDAEVFRFPLQGPVRIALIEGKFRAGSGMREFSADDLDWLSSYAPEVVVAPLDLALALAERRYNSQFELPSLKTAIVVLTSLEHRPLGWHDRDRLWQAFKVPVFEQMRGWNGRVIARECEVHDGLHIDELAPAIQVRGKELLLDQAKTGWSAEMVTGLCECGLETPRLHNAAVMPARRTVAAA